LEEDASTSADGGNPVQVVTEQVVGPYDSVTVRSSQGEALGAWLRANGYEVPTSLQPLIDAFTTEGFDFIALKLAPGEGVQAMQPVRVVTQGADLSLPLRMVAAGVGANVGIELYVLSEGIYQAQNFPASTIDFTKLAWDPVNNVSNYTTLATAALAQNGGRGWLTETAGPVALGFSNDPSGNPPLDVAYQASCVPQMSVPMGCNAEAGAPAAIDSGPATEAGGEAGETEEAGESDGQAGDGGLLADAAGAGDAGAAADSGGTSSDAGACAPVVVPCDDLQVAMTGITGGSFTYTRLRALLPSTALAADLVLEASPSQAPVPDFHVTQLYTVPNYNPCPTYPTNAAASSPASQASSCTACATVDKPGTRYDDVIVLGMLGAGVAFGSRRRRARSRG
jgi:hypothetical protein